MKDDPCHQSVDNEKPTAAVTTHPIEWLKFETGSKTKCWPEYRAT